jgi:hypothetical protein
VYEPEAVLEALKKGPIFGVIYNTMKFLRSKLTVILTSWKELRNS